MNKQEFIETLRHYLVSLPVDERNELLRDYEAHFIYGQQHGKTEAEIARELGDPLTLARDVVGADFLPKPPWTPPGRDIPRVIGVSIALFFLNIVAIPVIAAIWSAFVALCLVAVAGMLSPIVLALESALYGGYNPFKLFLAIGFVGIGMLVAALARAAGMGLVVGTIKYMNWNIRTWKGRSQS